MHIITKQISKNKNKKKQKQKQKKQKQKQKQTNKQKITYHTLHYQYTLHAFLTLLSKVLEREIIQIKLAVVLDMGQRDDITKLVNVGLHANKTM